MSSVDVDSKVGLAESDVQSPLVRPKRASDAVAKLARCGPQSSKRAASSKASPPRRGNRRRSSRTTSARPLGPAPVRVCVPSGIASSWDFDLQPTNFFMQLAFVILLITRLGREAQVLQKESEDVAEASLCSQQVALEAQSPPSPRCSRRRPFLGPLTSSAQVSLWRCPGGARSWANPGTARGPPSDGGFFNAV